MIKFRCPHCDQKLGVPDEYAGKRVRCSKCSQACQVPAQAAAPQAPTPSAPAPARSKSAGMPTTPSPGGIPTTPKSAQAQAAHPQVQTPVQEQSNPFDGLDLDNLAAGPNSEALAAARADRYKQAAKSSRGKDSSASKGGPFSGLALGAAKVPLSIAASLGFMIGVSILWTVVAVYTGKDFFIFPFCVAAAGAGGLVMFTEKRGVGLGLLSIIMALAGILIGKIMITKYVIMTEDTPFAEMSQEDKDGLIQDTVLVYDMGVMDLWQKGQFNETVAKSLIMENIGEESDEYYAEEDAEAGNEEPALAADSNAIADAEPAMEISEQSTEHEYPDQHASVCSLIEKWTPQEKQQAFDQHYQKYTSSTADWYIAGPVGFVLALLFSFSLWDLILIPASLVTAYKIGNGSND